MSRPDTDDTSDPRKDGIIRMSRRARMGAPGIERVTRGLSRFVVPPVVPRLALSRPLRRE